VQDLDDLHSVSAALVDHPITVACGDVVAEACAVDPAAHLREVCDQGRKVLDLRQYGIRRNGVQGAEVVIL